MPPESALQATPDWNPSLLKTAPQDCLHQEPGILSPSRGGDSHAAGSGWAVQVLIPAP